MSIKNPQDNMPRVTRDQQFKESFNEFIVSTRDLYYPDLSVWSLESLTIHKSSSLHEYAFEIPNQIVQYVVDAHTDVHGVHHPMESVEGEQEMMTDRDFVTHFKMYFGDYTLQKDGTMMSYTVVENIRTGETGNLNVTIAVYYYKSHVPYPCKHKSYEQLKERCEKLEHLTVRLTGDLDALDQVMSRQMKENRRLNKKCVESTIQMREVVDKMQSKMRELYQKSSVKEDCPVCYECIDSDQLMVPKCCHYICGSCYDRCDSCPMCRVEFP